jgi:hypothetical protein
LFGIGNGPSNSLDAYFPVAVIGNWYADGSGGVTRSLTVNFGVSAFPYDDHGTYEIAPDCTGSAFFPNDDEPSKLIFVDSKTIVLGVVSTDAPGRHGIARATLPGPLPDIEEVEMPARKPPFRVIAAPACELAPGAQRSTRALRCVRAWSLGN